MSVQAQQKPNRLIHEKSPYLLQHAYNPVDWYPWEEEAFEKARRENKLIFLSIGYSTCHWCHVMERESFQDKEIAEIMNRHFISIKIDREERPDVDQIYMIAVQSMTGSGGWPLSVWLTPDLKPFYGGTYFPPRQQQGRPGFKEVLEHIARVWREEPAKIKESSRRFGEALSQELSAVEGKPGIAPEALEAAFQSFQAAFDPVYAGFGPAPKFPVPVNIHFLLRYWSRTKNGKALEMAVKTLRAMARGGIYDHLGGGFHRYAVDERWHVPHFEKMLCDNAQLAVNYLEAYQITQDEEFAQTARETLDYALRDMAHPDGGFYSAEDADSLETPSAKEKREGAFYLWEYGEILKILGKEIGEIFIRRYGVEKDGNVTVDPHGEFKGKNILYAAQSRPALKDAKVKLLEIRSQRPRPQRDDKILTSWNGLMLSALARGYQVLGTEHYLQAAQKSAMFLRANLYDAKERRLYRRWREGERKVKAMADDYAFLIQGLMDLYEADFNTDWLEWAEQLTEEQLRLFYDHKDGGLYLTAQDHDKNLWVRSKEAVDNVEPAATSVFTLNLLRLAQFTNRDEWRKNAEKTLALFGEQMKQTPRSLPYMLCALDFYLSKPQQMILSGPIEDALIGEMLKRIRARFVPNKVVMVVEGGRHQKRLSQWLPFVKGMKPIAGKPTAYLCVNYACELPTSDISTFESLLEGKFAR